MIAGLKPYPVMKDSGVEWLGKIPDHWTEKRAKYFYREVDERSATGEEELLSVSHKTGVTPRKQSVTMFMAESTVGYKVCRPNDIAANTMWVFMGALGVSKQVGLVSPSYGVYRPIRPGDLLPEYVDRLLRVDGYKAEYMCRSTGINSSRLRLYPDDFLRIPIVCPPISEQTAIVRYLDHVDRRVRRLVRAKRKLIALLTEQKQAIIHRAVTRGLDPDVPLKDSGVEWLGEVPAHWEVVSLAMAAHSIQTGPFGSQLHADEYVTGGIPVVNPSHMRDGRIAADKTIAVNREKAEDLSRHKLESGDIVVARRGELGRCALVTAEEAGWLCGTGSLRIRVKKSSFDSQYLARLLGSQGVRDMLTLTSIGATMDNLNAGMVSRLRLPKPLVEEQRRIMEAVSASSKTFALSLDTTNREIDLLTEFRTRLTADVVTGKLDVREAAAALPEVDPLAADDEPDTLDAEMESDLAEPDVASEEADA